jgi:hypothetical protein
MCSIDIEDDDAHDIFSSTRHLASYRPKIDIYNRKASDTKKPDLRKISMHEKKDMSSEFYSWWDDAIEDETYAKPRFSGTTWV